MAMPRDNQLTCECGSTFFYVARAEQFQAGGYGSAEFRSMSGAPKTVLVCLCGKPAMPKATFFTKGTTAAFAEEEFRKSIEVSQKFRKANSLNNIAQIAASPAEVEEVQRQVNELRKAIEAIPSQVKPTTDDNDKAAPVKVATKAKSKTATEKPAGA